MLSGNVAASAHVRECALLESTWCQGAGVARSTEQDSLHQGKSKVKQALCRDSAAARPLNSSKDERCSMAKAKHKQPKLPRVKRG